MLVKFHKMLVFFIYVELSISKFLANIFVAKAIRQVVFYRSEFVNSQMGKSEYGCLMLFFLS